VPGKGTLTSLPEDGVSETLVIVKEKASMDVPGGGVSGLAARVKLAVALGSVQVTPEQRFGGWKPLHEPRPRAVVNRASNKRELRLHFIGALTVTLSRGARWSTAATRDPLLDS